MPESEIKALDKAILIAGSVLDKKAEDPVVLHVAEQSDFADYFVICSASSERGVEAIADNVERTLKKNKVGIISVEGRIKNNWVLIDASDVIIHIFYLPLREFYDIEGLYIDSPRIDIDQSRSGVVNS